MPILAQLLPMLLPLLQNLLKGSSGDQLANLLGNHSGDISEVLKNLPVAGAAQQDTVTSILNTLMPVLTGGISGSPSEDGNIMLSHLKQIEDRLTSIEALLKH